ncbi:MAG: hypothetical protein SFV15_16465 [Polyangiaceae bacterium]|nr:hypothetical protein [Polyangiaceae bacterium]
MKILPSVLTIFISSVIACGTPTTGRSARMLEVANGGATASSASGGLGVNSGGMPLGGRATVGTGAPGTGGATPGAGGVPSTQAGGMFGTSTSGGSSMATSGGNLGSGGAAPTATGGASSGVGGASPLPAGSPGEQLNGFRIEIACQGPHNPADETCYFQQPFNWGTDSTAAELEALNNKLDRFSTFDVGGDPNVIYDLAIRVQGVIETCQWSGGTAVNPHFMIGGGPSGDVNYFQYVLQTSDPPATYGLNGGGYGHNLTKMDYTASVRAKGGSRITVRVRDRNVVQVANWEMFSVPGIAPAPAIYDGQHLQFTVTAAVPAQ